MVMSCDCRVGLPKAFPFFIQESTYEIFQPGGCGSNLSFCGSNGMRYDFPI